MESNNKNSFSLNQTQQTQTHQTNNLKNDNKQQYINTTQKISIEISIKIIQYYSSILQQIVQKMKKQILIIILILCNITVQIDDSQAKLKQQSTKFQQKIYVIQPTLERYVIAVNISGQEQLFGIVNNTNPSWIFIDDGEQQHKICFEGVRKAQFTNENLDIKDEQLSTQNQQQKQQDVKHKPNIFCVDQNHIQCQGNCKQSHQLSQDQQFLLHDIVGNKIYEVTFTSQGKQITKNFLSAHTCVVHLSSQKQHGNDEFVIEEANFLRQQILNYYTFITGEFNIQEFQYVVIENTPVTVYFNLHEVESFSLYPAQSIIPINSPHKIKIKYNNKQMHELEIQTLFKFDSSSKIISLPSTIYTHLKQYIFKELLKQQKCYQINSQIYICQKYKLQVLQKQNFSICFDEGKCMELNLGDMVNIYQQFFQQGSTEPITYEYLLRFKPSENQNILVFYPQFAEYYRVLLRKGVLTGVVKYKPAEAQANLQSAQLNNTEHDHHEHIDETDKALLNGSSFYGKVTEQIIQTYQKASGLGYFFKVTILFTCCFTALCCYFKGIPKLFGSKDDQQTQLMDREHIQVNQQLEQSETYINSPVQMQNLNNESKQKLKQIEIEE